MRPGLQDDLDRLMAVMACAFEPVWGEAWTRRQVEDTLVTGHTRYRLVGVNGRSPAPGEPAAGFYLARVIAGEAELLLLAVDPMHRRRGLGARLLQALEEEAVRYGVDRIFLEMRRGNPAEYLYRGFGFVPIGERPNYYRTGDGKKLDAVTFSKSLRQGR